MAVPLTSADMTTPTAAPGFKISRLSLGVLTVVAAHLVVIGLAFLAGQLVEPSDGGGYEDVAAVVSVLLIGELIVFVSAIVASVMHVIKRRRDWAVGLFVGWALGPIGGLILSLTQASSAS